MTISAIAPAIVVSEATLQAYADEQAAVFNAFEAAVQQWQENGAPEDSKPEPPKGTAKTMNEYVAENPVLWKEIGGLVYSPDFIMGILQAGPDAVLTLVAMAYDLIQAEAASDSEDTACEETRESTSLQDNPIV